MSPSTKHIINEIFIRIVILLSIMYIEYQVAPQPQGLPQNWQRYKQPDMKQLFDDRLFVAGGCVISLLVFLISYAKSGNGPDLTQALLGITMGICLAGLMTSLMRVSIPKMRPNFFVCCFPDGKMKDECSGDPEIVKSGRKSFPSGHTSFAFVTMTFLFFYISSKLNVFNANGKGESWRLFVSVAPIIIAVMTGVFRTAKNKHHPEDVLAGGAIGSIVAFLCYRQRYPSIFDSNPGKPYELTNDDDE